MCDQTANRVNQCCKLAVTLNQSIGHTLGGMGARGSVDHGGMHGSTWVCRVGASARERTGTSKSEIITVNHRSSKEIHGHASISMDIHGFP